MSRVVRPIVRRSYGSSSKASVTGSAPHPPTIVMQGLDGILKLFVDHAVSTARSPQPFLALGAALCCVGAAAGRRYRSESDIRTNLMVIALADSGGGKERPRDCLADAFIKADMPQYLGGSRIGSSSGILTAIKDHPVVVFALDEIGHMLGINAGKNAGTHKAEILPLLTELFTRANGTYLGTNYGDSKFNPRVILHQPHVVLYGVTVPQTLWKAFGSGALHDGSLARFLVFQTPEDYPDTQCPSLAPMPDKLIEGLRRIAGAAGGGGNLAGFIPSMTAEECHSALTVPCDPGASDVLKTVTEDELFLKRKNQGTSRSPFWARLYEHTVRLSLIKAISRDAQSPTIIADDVIWASSLAEHCIRHLVAQSDDHVADNPFEAGSKKIAAFMRDAGEWVTASQIQRATQSIDPRSRQDMLRDLVSSDLVAEKITPPACGYGRPTKTYLWMGDGSGLNTS